MITMRQRLWRRRERRPQLLQGGYSDSEYATMSNLLTQLSPPVAGLVPSLCVRCGLARSLGAVLSPTARPRTEDGREAEASEQPASEPGRQLQLCAVVLGSCLL